MSLGNGFSGRVTANIAGASAMHIYKIVFGQNTNMNTFIKQQLFSDPQQTLFSLKVSCLALFIYPLIL